MNGYCTRATRRNKRVLLNDIPNNNNSKIYQAHHMKHENELQNCMTEEETDDGMRVVGRRSKTAYIKQLI